MAFLDDTGLTHFWRNLKTLLNGKVDKVTGKGLSTNDYTSTEKTKLAGLENYDDSAVKSDIVINRQTLGTTSKNLLKITQLNGNSADGDNSFFTSDLLNTLTINGTSNASRFISLSYVDTSTVTIPPGKYIASVIGDASNVYFRYIENGTTKSIGEYNEPFSFTVASGLTNNWIRLDARPNTTFNNVVIKVMLRSADITDDTFEPYQPSLQEQIDELKKQIVQLQN